MLREDIYDKIDDERDYQNSRWGGEAHDREHTPNDWVAFTTDYLGRAVRAADVGDVVAYKGAMIRVAALAVAALEVA